MQARLGGQEWQAPHVLPRRGSRRHDGRVVARSQVGLRLGFPGGTFALARMCFLVLVVALFCLHSGRGEDAARQRKGRQREGGPEAELARSSGAVGEQGRQGRRKEAQGQRQRREGRKHLLSLPGEGALDGHLPKEAGGRATRPSEGEGYRGLKGEYCFSLGVMFIISLLLLHAGAASFSAWPLRERRAHDEHLCSDSRAYRGFMYFRISCAV